MDRDSAAHPHRSSAFRRSARSSRRRRRRASDALQVEVIGHQWWWEFRYPQYRNVVTANELYLPLGRTVNFTLQVEGRHPLVLDSGARRQARRRHEPHELPLVHARFDDGWTRSTARASSTAARATRTCGSRRSSCAPADFESWAKHQQKPAVGAAAAAAPPAPTAATPARRRRDRPRRTPATAAPPRRPPRPPAARQRRGRRTVTQAGFIAFPREQIPAYTIPQTPLPAGLTFDDNLLAQGRRGERREARRQGRQVPRAATRSAACRRWSATIGPNLTHVAIAHDDRRAASIRTTRSTSRGGSRTRGDEARRHHADVRHGRVSIPDPR